ncbi:nickel pincer cofactor biosynthesis protein LarB [Rubrobacter aplysinae]|uniref:nickel pincer cofactor biosynthesis protein LarB n=1 Tax=Rubrobacter aplysinae TaxID=909625 RepID=UPI00064B9AFD|nr:nickel pincer cofactor biosynthesis protein LarB [Rubrobacter aplysinae]
MRSLDDLLRRVAEGGLSPADAAARLESSEVRYLDDFAALDRGRAARKGVPEVVYAPGKTPEQVAAICSALIQPGPENAGDAGDAGYAGDRRVIVSGAKKDHLLELERSLPDTPAEWSGRALVIGSGEPAGTGARVGALCAGTSDLPALGEALAVAREMGAAVESFHDVGVAGLHRLVAPLERLEEFDPDCLIVAAGMEGALPSVISGLVGVPVVGLPTSTGYGLGGDGTAAIMGMLQSCSPGLSVVNVDNGVGAGATAALMANRAAGRTR